MNYLKNMKLTSKQIIWLVFVALCIIFAPYVFEVADVSRGYDSTGGEIFIYLLPVLVWLADGTITDIKEEMNEYDS